MILEPDAQAWRKLAACRNINPDVFHPWPTGIVSNRDRSPQAQREQAAAAIVVCNICPVRPECLDFALASDQRDGVWGGLIPHDRRKLAKDRERQKVSA